MQRCPFCLEEVRQLGGIALITPEQLVGNSQGDPLMGACCVSCMGLIAITLDGLRNGRIKALARKYEEAGAIKLV